MAFQPPGQRDAGFSVMELAIVLALMSTVAAIALGGFSTALSTVRGDASMRIVLWQLKLARETAINQRRTVEVNFTAPNFITVVRRDIPAGTTLISTAVLEHQSQFMLFPAIPDTPDSFGLAAPVNFGGATQVLFNAEGQAIDAAGNVVNGTVFLGKAGEPLTARAVTVFGPTAGIRTYRWNGTAWRR
jgi:prepilin-type N-terminal cleavage/methylation domain-containing protein